MTPRQIKALAQAGAFFLAVPAAAEGLAWPVDCTLGQTCFIQHHVDRDPGPGVQDFGCGTLSYDGHDGTDIALATRAEMARGVAVLAAAAGVVVGVRDGIPDAAAFPEGQDCGNGVLIRDGAREVQYCHLRRGSVAVKAGDAITPGMQLGLIGQSGNADFPHLHMTLREGGQTIDPFSTAQTCGAAEGLWQDPPPYHPGGLVQIGISGAIPDYDLVKAGKAAPPDRAAIALVLWAEVFGAQPGDVIRFDLQGPDGEIFQGETTLERPQARAYRAEGRKRQVPPGTYHGTVTLIRDGARLDQRQVVTEVP